MRPFVGSHQSHSSGLGRNYFKVAWRNLARQRRFTVINVAGLTLGIACAILINLIVSHELGYDRYHTNANRVYRVNKGAPGDVDTGTPDPTNLTKFGINVGIMFLKANPLGLTISLGVGCWITRDIWTKTQLHL